MFYPLTLVGNRIYYSMNKTAVILEASTPVNISTPKTVKACLARLRELSDANARLCAVEVQMLNDKIDFLRDEPDHYL